MRLWKSKMIFEKSEIEVKRIREICFFRRRTFGMVRRRFPVSSRRWEVGWAGAVFHTRCVVCSHTGSVLISSTRLHNFNRIRLENIRSSMIPSRRRFKLELPLLCFLGTSVLLLYWICWTWRCKILENKYLNNCFGPAVTNVLHRSFAFNDETQKHAKRAVFYLQKKNLINAFIKSRNP